MILKTMSIEQALAQRPKAPEKIRVAILADMPSEALAGKANGRGGGHNFTWLPQLGDAFASEDALDIWWIIYDQRATDTDVWREAHQTFVRLPQLSMSLGLALGYLPYRIELRRLLDKLDPDVIHVWGTERAYPAILTSSRVPSILSLQGILTEYARIDCLPRGWKWKVMARHEPKWLSAADIVTVESAWGCEKVRTIVPSQCTSKIDYGVHPSFYNITWSPDRNRPIALFCGSLDRRKGVDLLVSAVGMLSDRNWECRIAGAGPLRARLESQGVRGVEFLGNLSWDQLRAEYARAWCLVLPTLGDTNPNVVKEARVVGLPVVTSRHGGQFEYVHDGENGIIIDPVNELTLARALATIMADYEAVIRMGRTHHQRDRDRLRSQRTADAFLNLYRELHEAAACV